MKCQKCDKVATYHFTDLINACPEELHLCDTHAYEYLHQNDAKHSPDPKERQLPEDYDESCEESEDETVGLKDFTEELDERDDQFCRCCEHTFLDFRRTGKFGCENDYHAFKGAIEPLLLSIQGDTMHSGKRPKRFKPNNIGSTLVRLRNQLADAINIEDYERASKIRDEIKALTSEASA
ncbi:MAG: UvrB/UvrC motif-containing protein [Thermoguttaceae bacterium]|jgi:protein arginine kinase activator|nr:UvrB/UvrC motif-containing protein [Thermoguttaceae bacterium]